MSGRRRSALVLCALGLLACGGSATSPGPFLEDGGGPATGDAGSGSALGEACTVTVSGAIDATFPCVVSHYTQAGADSLLFAADPRVTVKGIASFYDALQAKGGGMFSAGAYAMPDFGSAQITVTAPSGTKYVARDSAAAPLGDIRLALTAIAAPTATPSYDFGDQGTLDATLVPPSGASMTVHIAF